MPNLFGFSQGVWGDNPALQVNSPKIGILGKNYAAQDVLGRVSENMLNMQEQTSLRDRVELQFASVLEAEPSALSEIPTVLGEPFDYADKGADFWRIDPNAEDIYGEIDRTLGAVSNLTQTCRKGISVVAAELERRGYGGSSYMDYFRQWYQPTEPRQMRSELSDLVDRTLSQFRKKSYAIANGIEEQS